MAIVKIRQSLQIGSLQVEYSFDPEDGVHQMLDFGDIGSIFRLEDGDIRGMFADNFPHDIGYVTTP